MKDAKEASLKELIDNGKKGLLGDQIQPFTELMMQYRCAMREITTKLDVLNDEFSLQHNRNPIEHIESRLKSPESILEKLDRKGYPISVKSIEQNLTDIAGIRVVCAFPEDIYHVADMLAKQDDVIVVERKDYIANPKPNGYRSLHLIVDIPIFLSTQKKHMRVEVQFRTIAMDFWATLEHKLKYKKDIPDSVAIASELKECADDVIRLDYKMQEIRKRIAKLQDMEVIAKVKKSS
jgi:putative GTP pyrophosphokinase